MAHENNMDSKQSNLACRVLNWLSESVHFFYLALFLFFPYKPWDWPTTFSTIFLLLSSVLLCKRIFLKTLDSKADPSFRIMVASIVLFVASVFIFHGDMISLSGTQAYLVSFFVFFYFYALTQKHFQFLNFILALYLISSGLLIAAETAWGHKYYLSNFFSSEYVWNRYGSGFANTNSEASCLLLWSLAVFTTSMIQDKVHFIVRMIKYLAVVLGCIGLFYASSRTAWLIYFTILVLQVGVALKLKSISTSLKIFALSLIVFIACYNVPNHFYFQQDPNAQSVSERIERNVETLSLNGTPSKPTTDTPVQFTPNASDSAPDVATNIRVFIYKYAFEELRALPWWGVGIDQFPTKLFAYLKTTLKNEALEVSGHYQPYNAHNSFLSYIIEVGIIPAIPFFILICYLLYQAFKFRNHESVLPTLFGLISILTWSMAYDYSKNRILWVSLGMMAAYLRKPKKDARLL